MKQMSIVLTLSLLALSGCKKDAPAEEGQQAAAAASAPATHQDPANAAKSAPAKTAPAATDPAAQGAAQVQAAMEAMAKATAAGGVAGGKVVNWRKLGPFLPEKIGDFVPKGELKGRTGGMGQMQVTSVKRRYEAGDKKLKAEIVDTTLVPAMRAGFAMIQSINEDSSDGVRKGTTVGGQPALLEWRKGRQRGKLTIISGGRFLVTLTLRPTEDPEEVLKLAGGLDLSSLAKLKEE